MNPRLVLQLWRERWGKGAEGLPHKPYMRGRVHDWLQKLAHATAWSMPGAGWTILIASVAAFVLASSIEFSFNGRISYAGLLIVAALSLRLFAGPLFSLSLVCLSALCSAQYFIWRLSSMIEAQSAPAIGLAFGACAFEFCVVLVLLLGWIQRLWPQLRAETAETSETAETDFVGNRLRLNRSEIGVIQFLKLTTTWLYEILHFYSPLARLAFLTAPLVFLLAGLNLVNAKMAWWATYAIPTLALMGIAQIRINHAMRWSVGQEWREWALAVYFLAATSLSFAKTLVSNPKSIFWPSKFENVTVSFSKTLLVYALLLLNALGVMAGVAGVAGMAGAATGTEADLQHWNIFYSCWALCNVLLLLSRQAIEHESRQIVRFAKQQQRLRAMLRLPQGRTLSCETMNFPSPALELRTPQAVDASVDTPIGLTIFHNQRSYALSAQIVRVEGTKTLVQLTAPTTSDFEALRDTVLTRSSDWPMWLPARDADRPLPDWLSNAMSAMSVKILDGMVHFTKYLRRQAWAELWNKSK